MSDTYSVVLTGKLLDGYEPKSVQESFSELFKLSQDKVQAYFNGKPKVVKKAADHQTATRFKAKIESLGASVELRPVATTANSPATNNKTESSETPVQVSKVTASSTSATALSKQPANKQSAKASRQKVKKAFTEFTLDDCVNEIDFGRKKQISKMKAIEIAHQPKSVLPMLIGFGCLAFAAADAGLNFSGIMQITGTLWAPITAALVGLVAIKSSAEN